MDRPVPQSDRQWSGAASLPAPSTEAFLCRHGIGTDALQDILGRMAGLRVAVIGDLIVDVYVECEALGMSEEDPTIVVAPIEERLYLGGAGIVAAHARSLGATAQFLSIVGDDLHADFAARELDDARVSACLLRDPGRPTVVKRRYRARGKTLLRVNQIRRPPLDDAASARVLAWFDDRAGQTDLLMLSDFNYGGLPQGVVDGLIERSERHGIMVAADSQASSQYGNIGRFRRTALLTPTEREARLAIQDFDADLPAVAGRLQEVTNATNVVLTLGKDGLLARTLSEGGAKADTLPALNPLPADVAGAGDSLFAGAALALRAGADIWQSVYLGSVAAACQIATVGNRPVGADAVRAGLDAATN